MIGLGERVRIVVGIGSAMRYVELTGERIDGEPVVRYVTTRTEQGVFTKTAATAIRKRIRWIDRTARLAGAGMRGD